MQPICHHLEIWLPLPPGDGVHCRAADAYVGLAQGKRHGRVITDSLLLLRFPMLSAAKRCAKCPALQACAIWRHGLGD